MNTHRGDALSASAERRVYNIALLGTPTMNILLVTGTFPERSETFIYRKCLGLARRGHAVTVIARKRGDASLYTERLPSNVQVEVLPPSDALGDPRRAFAAFSGGLRHVFRSPASMPALAKTAAASARSRADFVKRLLRHLPFARRRFDIVHLEFLGIGAMYPLLGTVLEAPLVVSCRGQDVHMLELRAESERAALLEVLRAADALHCVSDELARSVERLTGRTHRVFVNRPAIDTDALRPRRTPSPRAPVRILASGRLTWVKGYDYLLAALARLKARGVAFHAEILGDGELKSVLRFSVEDLGLEPEITLVGAVPPSEVIARLHAADIFVLPSIEEGISNAVLEAMACGLPVVTTAAGGMAEAIHDGTHGFVVPVRDVVALADRLARLIDDAGLRERMGRAARARAETEFSLDRQLDRFEQIYAELRGERA